MRNDATHDRPMTRPDYGGGGIANLMASVIGGLGHAAETPPVPECPDLPAARLAAARHVVLLVVDGLGRAQLEAHAPAGALAQARVADLSSVFPSTTASAVSTFMTGDVPRTHGLTGWYLWFRELGVVGTPLPFRVRGSDVGLDRLGVDGPALFQTRALALRLARRTVLVHPAHLCDTWYTRAHSGGAEVRPFKTLEALFERIVELSREPVPSFCYAYWPELDALSHVHGAGSTEAAAHLRAVDESVARCARRLAGSGTLLAVCADHGFVDTRADTRLRLEDHPRVARTLSLPLCGEPRAAFCYVRSGAESDFAAAVADELGHAVDVVASSAIVADGLLGPGEAHPELESRLGSHVLLLKDAYCLTDRLAGERRPFRQVGVHGGMSDSELRVPLAVFES